MEAVKSSTKLLQGTIRMIAFTYPTFLCCEMRVYEKLL